MDWHSEPKSIITELRQQISYILRYELKSKLKCSQGCVTSNIKSRKSSRCFLLETEKGNLVLQVENDILYRLENLFLGLPDDIVPSVTPVEDSICTQFICQHILDAFSKVFKQNQWILSNELELIPLEEDLDTIEDNSILLFEIKENTQSLGVITLSYPQSHSF